jgi:hypothetical protein
VNTLPNPSARVRFAHLFALSAFGVAQPVFSLLSNKPYYLAIERFTATEVVLYSLALLLVVPLILLAAETLVDLVQPRVAGFLHRFFMGLLVALVVAHALHDLPDNYTAVAALVAALLFARLYLTWAPARLFLTFCSLAAVFFLAVFLVRAPLRELAPVEGQAAVVNVASQTPVVLVIFDELPESSLMTKHRGIDALWYPNFAALARSSTWYRNATTVHDYTFWAVPAILTGRRPRREQLPVFADHHENLFTLLGGSYRVHAFEPVTQLCPVALCAQTRKPFTSQMRNLRSHLHRFFRTGSFLFGRFPTGSSWAHPPREVARFTRALRPSRQRELYVLHIVLPHQPWRYLPSGRTLRTPTLGPGGRTWPRDLRPVVRGYEAHLLQVGYVDRVLGRIVARLRATKLWNRSLFIVTADHGVSFKAGEHDRTVDSGNISDIAPIPLFVKLPGQHDAVVDDRSARTIDILPTIADVLGIHVPWSLDGRSLQLPDRPYSSEIVVGSITGNVVNVPWSVVAAGRDRTIAWKDQLFGSGSIAPLGPTESKAPSKVAP